ncbi:hypothetical protein Q0Z83_037490 [Actinoplanes sichuanensis]|uniref:Trypsin-like peptidase domain-containing protein n=1 Tax=Actinoplanes sichuanensis TaxID=512349 RepID=A0ABW4A3E7_9ACTN|nr:trypsin-like peptidase domain-containing protein [Actinoplanes sichuanensis]BEL05558.1 hypothetical protein Q0Z83_037490 [Actinoplanes sichuanensis]
MPEDPGALESSIVRVRAETGSAVGAGFLVAGRTVLTCAHVVQRAGRACVDFPLLPGSAGLGAEITALLPALPDGTGDIAVLTLDGDPPPMARPARMVVSDDLWGHPCRLFGFSGGREDGVWAAGVLRGRQGAGWVQLESSGTTGYTVEPGFSGGAVWDDTLTAVVGMAVAAEVDGDLRAAYMIPTALLRQVWPASAGHVCPYRGLSAFRERDASVFFGREDRTVQLVNEIDRRSLVAVVGPSGTGKSSLVFGGLLPVVHQRPHWVTATMRAAWASSGVAALAAALLPLLEPESSETERLSALARLTGVLRDGHLRDVVSRILVRAGARRLLLIIDQFEEVFGTADVAELTGILLSGLGAGGVTAVVTLRTDFLGQALQLPDLAEALGESVTAVGEMDRHRLRQVIEKPLPSGMAYEAGLVDRILDDIGDEAGRLPLLEFALTLLWERQENGRLTHTAYQELGQVKGALARYAEQVYQEQVEDADREPFQRLLTQLVRPGESGEPVRRVARRHDLDERRWRLGQRLAATRLVTAGRDELGSETLELVHEALIDGWSRLRRWADEDHAFRVWQEDVRRDVVEWERLDRDAGALLRGMPLAAAVRWLGERDADIAEAERRYITASRVYQGRSVRRLRAIVAALAVLVLVAGGLGLVAVKRGREKAEQAAVAQAGVFMGRAQQIIDSTNTHKEVALLLSAAAFRLADNDQTRANLTLAASRYRFVSRLLPTEGATWHLMFSPSDPDLLAVSEGGGRISLWDVTKGTLRKATPANGPLYFRASMDFTPDGNALAFAHNSGRESRIMLWRHATGDPVALRTDKNLDNTVSALKFSPAGDQLAVCTPKGYQVWSLGPGDQLTRRLVIPFVSDSPDCLFAWTGNGTEVTFADGSDLVTWALATHRQRRVTVPLPADDSLEPESKDDPVISDFSATPDGRVATIKSFGGTIWWDLERRVPLSGFKADSYHSKSLVFSADGLWAFSVTGDLVRVGDRKRIRKVPIDTSGGGLLRLNRDGSIVVVEQHGSLNVVRLNDFDAMPIGYASKFGVWADGRRVSWFDHDTNTAMTTTFDTPVVVERTTIRTSRDEAERSVVDISGGAGVIVVIDPAHQLRLWNLQEQPSTSQVLTGRWHRPRVAALDDAGRFLAVAEESWAHVHDIATGAVVTVSLGEGFIPLGVAVSPGGRYVSVSDADSGRSRLWDVSSGTAQPVPLPDALSDPVFSPDGRWLGLSSGETVLVWDLERQTVPHRFPGRTAYAFDRQGSMILLEVDGTDVGSDLVEVYDLKSERLVQRVHRDGNSQSSFTADGTGLVVQGDGYLTVHPLDAETALRNACRLAGRELTPDEWRTHAPAFSYRKVCS